MKKRGALNLSMSTIVVVVIGVALLSFGLIFVTDLGEGIREIMKDSFIRAETKLGEVDRQYDERVTVSPVDFKVDRGSSDTFTVSIVNDLEGTKTFTIEIIPDEGNVLDEDELSLQYAKSATIAQDKQYNTEIKAKAEGKSRLESNLYQMRVTSDGEIYDEKTFFVEVVK